MPTSAMLPRSAALFALAATGLLPALDGTLANRPLPAVPSPPQGYGYVEYLPPGYNDPVNAAKKWPVVIWLQGAGERGNGSNASLSAQGYKNGFASESSKNGKDFPFLHITPQTENWYVGEPGRINSLINYVKATYRVDPKRVSIFGLCTGGAGAAVYTRTYPGQIAALGTGVLETGMLPDDSTLTPNLATVPSWHFHNFGDKSVYRAYSDLWVNAISQHIGGPANGPYDCMSTYPFNPSSSIKDSVPLSSGPVLSKYTGLGSATVHMTGGYVVGSGWSWTYNNAYAYRNNALVNYTVYHASNHNSWQPPLSQNSFLRWLTLQTQQRPWNNDVPMTIPGVIEAEAVDRGGEVRAFHETSSGNLGGSAFRQWPSDIDGLPITDGVDAADGASGAYLSHTAAGEWFEYTLNVTAGTYLLGVNAASTTGGELLLTLNGTTIGTCTVPAGDGSFSYFNLPNVTLATASNAVLRLSIVAGSVNVDRIATAPVLTASGPFGAIPTLPGMIEAEACDVGPGSFNDTTPANTGDSTFRNRSPVPGWILADAVDVSTGASGTVLSDAQSGEWFDYTTKILVTGAYDLTLSAASATGGTVAARLGATTLATFTIPAGGFSDLTVSNVALTRGTTKLRLAVTSGNVDIDRLSATFGASPAEIVVDNSDSECALAGPWLTSTPSSTTPPTQIGTTYLYVDSGAAAQATYQPYLPRAGSYQVSVRYLPATTRGIATYTTNYGNGASYVNRVNQNGPGTQWMWIPLGTFPANAGFGLSVTVDATGSAARVVADAIRFQEVTATTPDPLLIDNADLNRVSLSGPWLTAISSPNYLGEHYFTLTGTAPASVTYTPTITQAGYYQVQERHPSSGWLSVRSIITSVHPTTGAPLTTNVNINQNINAATWINVGSPVLMNVGTGSSVQITTDGLTTTTSARADAVRFVFSAPVANRPPVANADAPIVVNEDAVFIRPVASGLLSNDTDVDGNALTAELVNPAANGVAVINADGSFSYTPNANFNGSDSFSYRARDAQSASNTITIAITVAPVDDPVVAQADAFSTDEDAPLIVAAPGLLGNDSNIDAKPITVADVISAPAKGALTWAADGSFSYTPHADANGSDSFTYQIHDGTGPMNTAVVAITINPLDDAPVAIADSYWTRIERTLTVAAAEGVLANDSDLDGDVLTAGVVVEPLHGSLTLAADGAFAYTPEAGYTGDDSFTYRATGSSLSMDQTVNLLIKPLDIAPVIDGGIAVADPIATTTAALSISASDPDSDPAPLTYTWSATGPASATFAPNGGQDATSTVATFTAAGSYDITVSVSDGELATTSTRTVIVAQTPTTLTASPVTVHLANGKTKRVAASGTDQFGAQLNPMPTVDWSVVSGSVTVNADGDITAPASGTGSATVRASLGALTANVTVNVILPATGVGITRDDYTGAENTSDTARFKVYRAASAATALPVAITWTGSATAGVDYNALPSVVTIPANSTNTLVTVTTRNDALAEGREYVIGTLPADVNFTIAKVSDQIEIIDDEVPRIDVSVVDGSGTENTTDGITFRLTRYPVNSTVSVPVAPVMSGTATNGIDYTVPTDVTISGSAASVDIVVNRIDDADVEGTESIVLTVPAQAAYVLGTTSGSANLGDDENPQLTFALTDSTASEPGTDTGRVTVTRWPSSAAPLDVNYTVTGGLSRILPLPGVVQIPANTASAVITVETGDDEVVELHGSVTVTLAAGAYTLTGTTTGVITVTDNDFRSADAVAGNRAGLDYFFHTYAGNWTGLPDLAALAPQKTGNVTGFVMTPRTQNDRFAFRYVGYINVPADGTWTLYTNSDEGSKLWIGNLLVVNNDGIHGTREYSSSLLLRAGKHPIRVDYFDQASGESLTVSWMGPAVAKQAIPAGALFRTNAAPTATADAYSVVAGTVLTVAANGVLANDADVDAHALSAAVDTDATIGALALNADGGFTYAAPATPGAASFTYCASDGLATSAPAIVSITILPPNTAPTAVADAAEGITGAIIAGNVLANDSDAEGSPLTALLISAPADGTFSLDANGAYSFTVGTAGIYTATYAVSDGELSAETTLTITVSEPPNTAPTAVADADYAVNAGEILVIAAPGVLANDSDAEAQPLVAILASDATDGALALAADGSFTFTAPLTAGTVTFTYVVSDGLALSTPATVTITVNAAPTAVADAYTVTASDLLVVAAPGLLANDLDPESDPLSVELVTDATDGALALAADGSFTFTAPETAGTVTFTYRISDGAAVSEPITVTITVEAPVAEPG